MRPPIYIGDEVTGAGYRLAGAEVLVPGEGREAETLEQARARAPLVLVSATVAARIPPRQLAAAQAAPSPLLLIVADLVGGVQPPDLAQRLRTQLGMEA